MHAGCTWHLFVTCMCTPLRHFKHRPFFLMISHLSLRDIPWNVPQMFRGWVSLLHAMDSLSDLAPCAVLWVAFGTYWTLWATLSWCHVWMSKNFNSSLYRCCFTIAAILHPFQYTHVVSSSNLSSIAAVGYTSKVLCSDAFSALVCCHRRSCNWCNS